MPDASLPQFNPSPIGPNIGQSIGVANQLLQFKQEQEQIGRQNALRTILGTPGAIDATGQPTPQTLTKVMGVDPNAGLQLQQNALVTQQRKLQMDALTTKTAFDTASYLNDAYSPILEQYKDNVSKGMPEPAARREAQDATTSTTERLRTGGGIPPNVAQTLPTQFDPAAFERKAMQSSNYMQWWKEQDANKKQEKTDQRAGEQTMLDKNGRLFVFRPNMPTGQRAEYADGTAVPEEMLGGARKAGTAVTKPEEVMVDGHRTQAIWDGTQWKDLNGNPVPTTSTVTRVAKEGAPGSTAANREAIASDINNDPQFKDATPGQKGAEVERQLRVAQGLINTPEQIDQEAQQIASYSSAPLTGYALRSPAGINIMARVHEIDPNYSALEFNNYNKTISGFGAGKQGDTIRYINNAIQHIDVMQKAADALGSGDMRSFNTLANALGREFGKPAPTTFDGLRQIVGTEIERAATGGVGAAIDRDRLIESLNKANSPDQLKDVFKNFKALFGGQSASLKAQYESGTPERPAFRGDGLFSFDKKLLPETRRELPGFDGTKGTPQATQTGTAGGKTWPPVTPDAVADLKAGHGTAAQFDSIFGPGAADRAGVKAPTQGAAQQPTAATPAPATATPATATPQPTAQAPAVQGTATAPLPLTKGMKQTDLVSGKVYQTRYGPATWDGKQFVAVQ